MKKQLLSIAAIAALVPAYTVNAEEASLTAEWSAVHMDPDPNSYEGFSVGVKPCIRFATAMDGKIYVVNQKTAHIAEVTPNGIEDRYALPATMGKVLAGKPGKDASDIDDFYGTALSRDDAGNFLVGHVFTYSQSATLWTAFNPTTGEFKHFNTEADFAPNDMNPGRIDCVGRVLGDLFDEAIVYVAPAAFSSNRPAGDDLTLWQRIQCISFMGKGTIASSSFGPKMYMASANSSVAQPRPATFEEYKKFTREENHPAIDACQFLSVAAGSTSKDYTNDYYGFMYNFHNGDVGSTVRMDGFNNYPNTSAYDTFVLDGKRYFAMNYMPTTADYANDWGNMNVGIFDEMGTLIAKWENPDFKSSFSYESIIAEPIDDETAVVCVYACTAKLGGMEYGTGVAVGAAKLIFKAGDVVAPEKPDEPTNLGAGTQEDPYQINNAADLCEMHNKIVDGQKVWFALMKDIDMEGVTEYIPAIGSDGSTYIGEFEFDGRNHVIRNFAPTNDVWYQSIFGVIRGTVKNLGVENCNINCTSSGTGALGGYGGHNDFNGVVDNVWVTGKVKGSGYTGGLVGTNVNLKITNSYFNGDVDGGTFAGGLVGRGRNGLTIENCYAYGTVTGGSNACGLVGSDKPDNTATIKNSIAWNAEVNCSASAAAVTVMAGTQEGVLVWDGMKINSTDVTGGTDFGTLVNTATGWAAYADKVVNGLPALKWQVESDGVEGVVADDAIDAAPVYYNLQGVQVENPGAGLYIVKRGNKVTKEIIR